MSKFWGGADSSDSEDDVSDKELLSGSEGSEGSGDEGEGEGEKDIDWGLDSDPEDEGTKRVVKSVRDKRYEEMHKLIESLENDIKEANWVSINTGTLHSFRLPISILPACIALYARTENCRLRL
jgi:translation initiation factor 3 subunit C